MQLPAKPAPTPVVKAKAPKAKANTPLSHGVGRRKRSVARAWLRRGTGSFMVNGKDFTDIILILNITVLKLVSRLKHFLLQKTMILTLMCMAEG